MNPTVVDVTAQPAFTHTRAMELLAVELDLTIDLLRSLGDAEWTAQTDCPDWDVRQMYLHVLGACEAGASMKENVHQMRAAKKHCKTHGGPLEAGLSNVQVRERLDLTPEQLVSRLADIAPTTVKKRTKTPSLMRRMPMNVDGPVVEKWTLGYLIDTIYLRDLWMHRVDLARATGRELQLSSDHDGVIVADVVAEWARRHGQPMGLTLTGAAGGFFASTGASDSGIDSAPAGEPIELDAVEFCRILAGRAPASTTLLETIVPF